MLDHSHSHLLPQDTLDQETVRTHTKRKTSKATNRRDCDTWITVCSTHVPSRKSKQANNLHNKSHRLNSFLEMPSNALALSLQEARSKKYCGVASHRIASLQYKAMNIIDRSFHPTHIDSKICSTGHANTDTRTHRSRYSCKRKRRHMHTTKDPQRTKDRVWTAQTQNYHISNVHPVEQGQAKGFQHG